MWATNVWCSWGKKSRAADSTDVAVYDAHVQGRIAGIGHAEIKAYSSHFKVLGSTSTVNARMHTGTTGTGGVPIYWLIDGPKVADNYADFYDGTWDDKDGATLEDGTSLSSGRKDQFICTGTNDDGTTASQPLGAATCAGTKINISGNTLTGRRVRASQHRATWCSPASSGSATSPPPSRRSRACASPRIPAATANMYKDDADQADQGDVFGAVAVTGTPKIKLRLSTRRRRRDPVTSLPKARRRRWCSPTR